MHWKVSGCSFNLLEHIERLAATLHADAHLQHTKLSETKDEIETSLMNAMLAIDDLSQRRDSGDLSGANTVLS